ncbi:maleylpyruvate isomerase N-terminal domain-containing protein [Catellatospora coxensis]
MTGPAEEHRRTAEVFTARVRGVAPGDWDRPAPCPGWVARDVVGHLVEWFPGFLRAGAGSSCRRARRSRRTRSPPGRSTATACRPCSTTPPRRTRSSPIRTSARCPWTRRSPCSTPPTSSCTPGTWPAPPGRTSAWTPSGAPCCWGCCRWTRRCAPAGTTARKSRSPTTPTRRPACSPSSAAPLTPVRPAFPTFFERVY